MIVVTADVGGSKITVAITQDGERIASARGPGSPVRPGRAIVTATAVADLVRSTMAQAGLLRADALVVGAAGAGRASDANEMHGALLRERIAPKVVVVTDVELAFHALGIDSGLLLVAGTGSIVTGRTPDGRTVRQGGMGWQMGDEGGGYWIGRAALTAAGRAHDQRAEATALLPALLTATGASTFRDLVGWSTVATPREVAHLTRAVFAVAAAGDPTANEILRRAAAELAGLVNSLAGAFPATDPVPVGLAGGILTSEGLLGPAVAALIGKPFVPIATPIDPLAGGPPLAGRP